MPDKSELEGAIDGLLRLQYVYRLKAKDLVNGILDGVDYGRLSISTCHVSMELDRAISFT